MVDIAATWHLLALPGQNVDELVEQVLGVGVQHEDPGERDRASDDCGADRPATEVLDHGIVLAAGGIDVSFTAIAAFTMYSLTVLVLNVFPGMPMTLIVVIATAMWLPG